MKPSTYFPAITALLAAVDTFAEYSGHVQVSQQDEWIPTWITKQPVPSAIIKLALGLTSEPVKGKTQQSLRSIFCGLTADNKRVTSCDAYWPLQPLGFTAEATFPIPSLDVLQVKRETTSLWKEFYPRVKEIAEIHSSSGSDQQALYLENLLLLLQQYTWCLPTPYETPDHDVSLFDFARMTAALSAALPPDLSGSLDDTDMEVALLVGGDITGIQSFLYTISDRGAAGALRGRSFYLQLLTEATARYILRCINLPVTNLIYAGGGGFYLLARKDDGERLREVQTEVARVLLAHHSSDLYLALQSQPLTGRDFSAGGISHCWGQLAERLQHAKLRRYAGQEAELIALFEPQGHGGNEESACSVCGREDAEIIEEKDDAGSTRRRVCHACKSYEELGNNLRRAKYLVLQPIAAKDEPHAAGYPAVLGALGLKISLLDDVDEQPKNGPIITLALTDQAYTDVRPNEYTAVGRRLMVNTTPLVTATDASSYTDQDGNPLFEGSVRPFDLLERRSHGISRLGVLRMDVDNLGKLFSQGMENNVSLARLASLSFAVSRFFEGRVGKLAEELDQALAPIREERRLYSIYSGGDDLFFVGSWDAVIELARRIRAELEQYVAGHPGIHASGGVVLIGGKYPLAQAAEDAAVAESQAKAYRRKTTGRVQEKDAITFLGQTIAWKQFGLKDCSNEGFESVHSLMHFLVQRAKNLHPVLRRLIRYQEMYDNAIQERVKSGRSQNSAGEDQPLWGPWNWLSMYELSRLEKKDANGHPAADGITRIKQELEASQFQNIEWIGLAARWAELYGRENAGERE